MTLGLLERTELAHALELLSRKPVDLHGDFAEQDAFVQCPDKRIVACCSRRSGKSYGIGLRLFRAALSHPGSTACYFGLTRQTAKNVLWSPILKAIAKRYKIACKPNESELRISLGSNGASIQLSGLDCDDGQMEKSLGQKPCEVIVDECQSLGIDLERFEREIIGPSLVDHRAPLVFAGTPNGLTQGHYYDCATGKHSRWTRFHWTADRNQHVAAQWAEEISSLRAENPDVENLPWFRNAFRGEWVTDTTGLVYSGYRDIQCDYSKLPEYTVGAWHYVLGVDPGLRDAAAFVVLACHDLSPVTYVVSSSKATRMDVTAMAEHVRELQQLFELEAIVVDNAAAQAIAEIQNRHGLPVEPCEKPGKKWEHIQLINAELGMGRIKIHEQGGAALRKEWRELRRTRKSGAWLPEEDPRCANHCSDAALYAWRRLRSFLTLPDDRRSELEKRQRVSEAVVAHVSRIRQQQMDEAEAYGVWEE